MARSFQVHTTACKRPFSLGCVAHTDGAVFQEQDMAQHALRMRKLRNRKAEFDLLYYAFNGARIFFRGEGAKVVAPSETAL